jgi:hypothetical protein
MRSSSALFDEREDATAPQRKQQHEPGFSIEETDQFSIDITAT